MKRLPLTMAWDLVPMAMFFALASTLCLIVQWRYAIFRNGVDLGIFTQVIASVGHGFSSTPEGGVNHLLVHWSPVVVFAWPFLHTFGPLGLEYFQAALVAAVLFPIWGLARARFSAPIALLFLALVAINPILWANGVGDFHEMAFVPLLSAALVYALDRRRWTTSIAVALVLICTKEDQFVALATNGLLFAATAHGDAKAKRTGFIICGLAIAMSLAYFGPIRHMLNPGVPYLSFSFFDWKSVPVFERSFLLPRFWYVVVVFAPLAFLPCLSRYGLFLIPGLVEILASHRPVTLAPGAHYSALLTGYALAGFVDGASRLAARRPQLVKALLVAAAASAVGIGIFASPMEYWYYLYRRPNAHDALLEHIIKDLPPVANVGSEDEIFAHLGLDPKASIGFRNQRWFIYDRTHYSERWHETDEPAVRRALAHHIYLVTSDRDGIVVLKRLRPSNLQSRSRLRTPECCFATLAAHI